MQSERKRDVTNTSQSHAVINTRTDGSMGTCPPVVIVEAELQFGAAFVTRESTAAPAARSTVSNGVGEVATTTVAAAAADILRRAMWRRTRKARQLANPYNAMLRDELERLQEEVDPNSHLPFTYARALDSICKCPLPLRDVSELEKLKYVGPMVRRRISEFWERIGLDQQRPPEPPEPPEAAAKPPPKKKKKRAVSTLSYVPRYRSGAYAILVALGLEERKSDYGGSVRKAELISLAEPHCDTSFYKTATTPYSAWSSMATLKNKQLVVTEGNPVRIFLTGAGLELANKIIDESPAANTSAEASRQQPVSASVHRRNEVFRDAVDVKNIRASDYEVYLLVDNRERLDQDRDAMVKYLKNSGIKADSVPLSVGDMMWVARPKNKQFDWEDSIVLYPIIERKSIADLASSIKDGRYMEQKFRLKKAKVPLIMYLVEGDVIEGLAVQESALRSALAESQLEDNFYVHRTSSITGTLQFLVVMSRRVIRQLETTGFAEPLTTFSQLRADTKKSQPLSTATMFGQQLCAINGMGVARCEALITRYESARALWEAYEACPNEEAERLLLASLKYKGSGDLERNFGVVQSQRVRAFFRDGNYRTPARGRQQPAAPAPASAPATRPPPTRRKGRARDKPDDGHLFVEDEESDDAEFRAFYGL